MTPAQYFRLALAVFTILFAIFGFAFLGEDSSDFWIAASLVLLGVVLLYEWFREWVEP